MLDSRSLAIEEDGNDAKLLSDSRPNAGGDHPKMKAEYLAFAATIIPALPCFLLALWEKPPAWLRITGGLAAITGAILAGIAGIASSNESASLITGGDSFCYLDAEMPSPPFPAIVVQNGEYPLYDPQMRLTNLLTPLKPITLSNGVTVDEGINFPLPNLALNTGAQILALSLPVKDDRASFNIFFFARNGSWSEALRLRLVNGKWKRAIQVSRRISSGRDVKQIFEQVDKGYPVEPDGKVKW
jgi:hypothetical protein